MSLARTIGRGVAWNALSSALGKITAIVNIFIILRVLTVRDYGVVELILTVVSVGSFFLLPGLTSAITADLVVERSRKNLGKMNGLFRQYVLFTTGLGVVAWAALFFGAAELSTLIMGNEYVSNFLKIASWLFLVAPFRATTQLLANVMLRYFDISFFGVFEELFKFIFLIVFVVWLRLGAAGLLWSIVLSQVACVILYAPRSWSAVRMFWYEYEDKKSRFFEIVNEHRKWSIVASYIGPMGQNLRIWLVKLMLGTEAVGYFSFAYGFFSHLTGISSMLVTVLAPLIPRYVDKVGQLGRIVFAAMKVQTALSLVILLGFWLFGSLFVQVLFPKYVQALPLLYVIVLAILPNNVVALFTPVFAAYKEQRSLAWSYVVKFVLTGILLPPAIMMFGMVGIGLELILTSVVNGWERYVRLKRIVPEAKLSLTRFFSADPYEREAIQVILGSIRSKFLGGRL